MDLKKDYNRLYQHWLREFERTELTPFTEGIFQAYKKSFNTISNYKLDDKDEIKVQLIESYKHNFEFLFNDFLKIREIKIINAALALQDIDLEQVIEAEKLFYKNLVSSIKGFKKLKALSVYEDFDPTKLENDILKEESVILEKKETEAQIDDSLEIKHNEILEKLDLKNNQGEMDYEYTVIRFLKRTPPLVGIDLINYGPFEENDIANLPKKNAKILLYEKFAEEIDIS
jgi:DNA replication initiation complex subunit (GINS family)